MFVDEHGVLHVKVVYWGVGLAGKQTTLKQFYHRAREERRSALTQIASATERTLFFIGTLEMLDEVLAPHGKDLATTPMVFQYNKRDLENALSVEALDAKLNREGRPRFETIATEAQGIVEPLRAAVLLLEERAPKA